ncbi:MAG: XdhC family protein [Gemmatimonadetes bacterium]|nr:XdhC family protein [Gemmatimonadota bacterium]
MTLNATAAADIVMAAVESGHSAVTLVTVSEGAAAAAGTRLVVVTTEAGEETVRGTLGSPEVDAAAVAVARTAIADPRRGDGLQTLAGAEIYVEVRRPIRDLVIVGAGHIARPMSRMGADLGFRIWVLDDRPEFATLERFPDAYRVVKADFSDPFEGVPLHRNTHVLLVTRGHKYDYDCLVQVLRRDPAPAYIGMIGSRRRVRATFVQLLADGIPRERLAEIHAPVGLDLGAETPEEIAVAVAAELVKVYRGGSGRSLREMERIAERFFGERGASEDEEKEDQ